MKQILIILFTFSLNLTCHAEFLSGEVEYNHEKTNEFNIESHYFDNYYAENLNCLIEKSVEFKNRKVVRFSDRSYGVKYFKTPLYSFYYLSNGKLLSYTKREREGYPSKITKYSATGNIINKGYQVSQNESFWYSLDGELIAHWVNSNCYDKNGKIIMTRKDG